MSSRNDNSDGAGLAILAAGIAIMAAILFALAAFTSAILTVLCIIAWDKPLRLGKFTIEPHEAQAFIGGGIVGMWLLPIFAGFCSILFQIAIANYVWSYLLVGGYVAGSLGTGWFVAQRAEKEAEGPAQIMTHPAAQPMPQVEQTPPPYHFATWDDEEELK